MRIENRAMERSRDPRLEEEPKGELEEAVVSFLDSLNQASEAPETMPPPAGTPYPPPGFEAPPIELPPTALPNLETGELGLQGYGGEGQGNGAPLVDGKLTGFNAVGANAGVEGLEGAEAVEAIAQAGTDDGALALGTDDASQIDALIYDVDETALEVGETEENAEVPEVPELPEASDEVAELEMDTAPEDDGESKHARHQLELVQTSPAQRPADTDVTRTLGDRAEAGGRPPAPEDETMAGVRWSLLNADEGESRARVHLEHPTLGKLQLDFALEDGQLDIRVVAPDVLGAIMLEQDADAIRALLEEHGAQLADLRVDVSDHTRPESEPAPRHHATNGRLSLTA